MMASITMTEQVTPMDTLHVKLPPRGMNGSPGKSRQNRLKLDPLRALEPARKKLTSVEAQRILSVLEDTIKRTEVVTLLPYIAENMNRYSSVLGPELCQFIEDHKVTKESYIELKETCDKLLERRRKKLSVKSRKLEDEEDEDGMGSRPNSASSTKSVDSITSTGSRLGNAMRNLNLVSKQMNHHGRNILRDFGLNPSALNAIRTARDQRSDESNALIATMEELRNIIMEKLLTTPAEQSEKREYLTQITERERHNSTVIKQLEDELGSAMEDKEAEIKKKNDVIRRLQADLHQIEKFSEENIKRTRSEAEKQESADQKNSEGKRQKLQQDVNTLKMQLQTLISEHRESEMQLRKRKFKIETEVENWIQRYDGDMGERQDLFEEIDTVYTEEKKQLNELEERFKTLEEEYKQIQEERRIARERREAAEREMQLMIKAATTIQAFWRSFKVRKALKQKKKKGKGKKGKGKKK